MPIPFLIAALMVGKSLVEHGLEIDAQRKQARIYQKEGDMEAAIFGKNADIAKEQAKDAIARGNDAELRQRFKMRTLAGTQQASFSGQGVTTGVGSAGQVATSDFQLGEMDALNIRENAAREALGFQRQADIFQYQGEMVRLAARNKARATRNQGWTSLINFGGDMFSLYAGGKGNFGSSGGGAAQYGASSYPKGMFN